MKIYTIYTFYTVKFKRTKMRIVTFGEILMRLNPEGYQRFVQADKFEASYAGGEANVAVSLAALTLPS